MNTLIACVGVVCSISGAPTPMPPAQAARVLVASSSQRFIAAPPEQAGPQWITIPRPAPLPITLPDRTPPSITFGLPHAKHRR